MRSDLVAVKERADALVKLALQRAAGPVTGSAETVAVGAGAGGSPFTRPTVENAAEQLRHYNGRVYAAIRPVAHRIASMEWMVGRVASAPKTGAKLLRKAILPGRFKSMPEHVEALPQHPILDVLHDPNRLMVAWTLKVVSVVQLLLTGKCFWWLVPPKGGKAAPRRAGREIDYEQQWQIWPLPASWVRPVHEEGQPYASWKIVPYGSMGKEWSVPLEEIAYFYLPDPQDPTSAHSPLQANARAVVSHEAINEAQRRSFHRPFPGLVFTIGRHPDAKDLAGSGERPMLSGRQREEIMAWVQAMYEGMDQYNKPLIQDALIEKVEQLAKSPREMDFMKSNDAAMAQIDEGIGSNPVIMGRIENLSRASSAVADDHFCFPGDTLILTAQGMKRIDAIAVGDKVLTHRGRWRAVTATMRRPFSGAMSVVKAAGSDPIRSTGNHPFWVRRAGTPKKARWNKFPPRPQPGAAEWLDASSISAGDFLLLPAACETIEPVIDPSEWISVRRLRRWEHGTAVGGGVKLHGNKTKKTIASSIVVAEDTAFVLGLWLAEGHSSRSFGWSLHGTEEVHLKKIIDEALIRITGEKTVEHRHHSNGNVVCFKQHNATFRHLLRAMFGVHTKEKRIPFCVFGWPVHLREAFLKGYLQGDGSVSVPGACKPLVQYSSVSPGIAHGVRYLLAGLGIVCNLYCYERRGGEINGRRLGPLLPAFAGRITGDGARRVLSWFDAPAPVAKRSFQSQSFADTDGVWCKVQEVATEEFSGEVFNFSVEEDESYCTAVGAVHNCRNTVNPIQTMMSETLTSWLPPLMAPNEDICIFQQPAASVDVDHELAKASAMVSAGCFLMNEVRRQFGEEPHPAGDRLLVTPMGLVPWDGDPEELAPADPAAVDGNGDPADPEANDGGSGGSSGDPAPDPEETDATDPAETDATDPAETEAGDKSGPGTDLVPVTAAGADANLLPAARRKDTAAAGEPMNITLVIPENAIQVHVTLPEMPAPIVNVQAPQVTIEVPPAVPTTRVVQRDANGNIQMIRDVPQG